MATGLVYSVALDGVVGRVVTVEADVHDGVPAWALGGLPDTVVAQARDRCRAAIVNSGHAWPDRRITVALYPADVPKIGSHYDLAIALALLAASGVVLADSLPVTAAFGELALDGRLRPVPGVLPAVLAAREAGLERVIVPADNAAEARLVDTIGVLGVGSLAECVSVLTGQDPPGEGDRARPLTISAPRLAGSGRREGSNLDLGDVRGQPVGRWCVEVAAAGGHHLFLHGPPGAGKTMLAERLPDLLPPLTLPESIEVSAIHSVAGVLSRDDPRIVRPPFLAPHHQDTVASVVGGGSKQVRPGAISLAHRGVLFLDEAPEFKPTVHDALRQPLESGEISIRRADSAARFPSRFLLLLAANPCPCSSQSASGMCRCTPAVLRRYQSRISGPVRDRIDITHRVSSATRAQMRAPVGSGGSTASVAARVLAARERQRARFDGLPWLTNGSVPSTELRARGPLDPAVADRLEDEIAAGHLSQRGADRVVRLAWTLADLEAASAPTADHVEAALCLRQDRAEHFRRGGRS